MRYYKGHILILVIVFVFSGFVMTGTSHAQDLRQLLEYLQTEPLIPEYQEPVYARDLLLEIYQSNDFKPLWDNPEYAERCLAALEESERYGLLPQDYHSGILNTMLNDDPGGWDPGRDIMLTDGLLLYAHHLLNGKLNPRDFFFSWNFPQRILYQDSIRDFLRKSRKEKVIEDLLAHQPSFPVYWRLVSEREKWLDLEKNETGQDKIVIKKAIKPGDTDEVLRQVCRRLTAWKFLDSLYECSGRYDSTLIPGVVHFQRTHGLDPDGVIGEKTIAYLNLSVRKRIDAIDANLERLRWLSGGADDNMVFVNIAGFHLTVVRDRTIIWDTPVMTGTVDTQTPVFTSKLNYLVFNPSWTVPRGVLYRSLFSRIRNEPDFLIRNNYELADPEGNRIDPRSLNTDSLEFRTFRYTLIQKPGPNNAMGAVKFMFPNQYSIYLHDTPSKSLFSKSARAFSNGCIRVKDPLTLARILLNDESRYSDEKIKNIVDSGITKTVFLKDPVNILLVYLTVDLDNFGRVIFRDDIYHRDKPILDKLRTPMRSDFF